MLVNYHSSPSCRPPLYAFNDVNTLELRKKKSIHMFVPVKEIIFRFSKCPFFLRVLYDSGCMAEFKSSVLPSVFQNTVVC